MSEQKRSGLEKVLAPAKNQRVGSVRCSLAVLVVHKTSKNKRMARHKTFWQKAVVFTPETTNTTVVGTKTISLHQLQRSLRLEVFAHFHRGLSEPSVRGLIVLQFCILNRFLGETKRENFRKWDDKEILFGLNFGTTRNET